MSPMSSARSQQLLSGDPLASLDRSYHLSYSLRLCSFCLSVSSLCPVRSTSVVHVVQFHRTRTLTRCLQDQAQADAASQRAWCRESCARLQDAVWTPAEAKPAAKRLVARSGVWKGGVVATWWEWGQHPLILVIDIPKEAISKSKRIDNFKLIIVD